MHIIDMPQGARAIVQGLQDANYEAYVVGGCVRDSLLGLAPADWDICTSATPEEMKEHFARRNIPTIDTGIKHGTITVDMGFSGMFEVTTFRIDGDYSDNRHPDSVRFTRSIHQDLSRRDFTVNAMAFNQAGLVDPFHGKEDLRNKVISCVGNPDERFSEDALRILRALRFASTYQFRIDGRTAVSIHKNKHKLKHIAAELICSELCKMLQGKGILDVLLAFGDVFAFIIPELAPCIGFAQNNRFHQYTVYEHIAHAVASYHGGDTAVNMALLLHDIGKPLCYTEDENGGHFYGHAVLSRDIAEGVLNRLRLDNKTKNEVLELILYHDSVIDPTPKTVRRWLNRIGQRRMCQLIDVRLADVCAQAESTRESRLENCHALGRALALVLEQRQCFARKDLEIKGGDLLSLGMPQSPRIGEILNILLEKVIAGEIPNKREVLMQEAVRLAAESCMH